MTTNEKILIFYLEVVISHRLPKATPKPKAYILNHTRYRELMFRHIFL